MPISRASLAAGPDCALPASLGGTAQDRESADPAVALRAAGAAQAMGDVAAYNYFFAAMPRRRASRKILKAAASRTRPVSVGKQVATWSSLLAQAVGAGNNHDSVVCVAALARLGHWPPQADSILSTSLPPDAAATIRAVAKARAGDCPPAVSELRDLAAGNVIAALELILLVEETEGADVAIAECERQTQDRMHAQLILRHVDHPRYAGS